MQFSVMRAAKGDRKLIADLLSQSARLRKPQMMRVAGLPPADEAGLFCHKAQVVTVAQAPRLRQSKNAFVNPGVLIIPGAFYFGGRQSGMIRFS
jgi:hypothetical protein